MSDRAAQSDPLSGITVIDLSHVYNGPYATFLMAMAGATVIKVDPMAASTCAAVATWVARHCRSRC